MSAPIGFMQGRLSPLVDGKIQAFPTEHWRAEFAAAEALAISLMEWTLDQHGLHDNPLMTSGGRAEIDDLSLRHGLSIPSLTGDCIMQAPFYKAQGTVREGLLDDFAAIVAACGELGIEYFVVPLVDDGGLVDAAQERSLFDGLAKMESHLRRHCVQVVFESDLPPENLASFIARLPADLFGINLDLGNSAALGFDTAEEIEAYGARIYNVHIKDRVLGGTTVSLGTGNADLPRAIGCLKAAGYKGNYILQTARAEDENHAGVLSRYRDMIAGWLGDGT